MEVLLLSGIGMTMAGGSYPASQGEHMIAHSYNMLKKSVKNIKLLHGEEIGVTSLYMAVLQENFLKKSPILFSEKFDRNYLSEIYGNNLAEEFSKEFSTKQNRIREYCPTLNKNKWDSICEKLQKIMLPTKELEHIITKAELKTSIEALGWGENDFRTAATTARFTRSRFTFLDFE